MESEEVKERTTGMEQTLLSAQVVQSSSVALNIVPRLKILSKQVPIEESSRITSLTGRTFQRYTKGERRRFIVGGIPFRLRFEHIEGSCFEDSSPDASNKLTIERDADAVENSKEDFEIENEEKADVLYLKSFRCFIDFLAVAASRGDEWILPKGGWESFETLEEGAKREVEEEAGVATSIESYLGVNDGRYGTKGTKGTSFRMLSFFLRTEQIFTTYAEGHRARRWFNLEELSTVITRPAQVAIVKSAFEIPQIFAYVFIESIGFMLHGGDSTIESGEEETSIEITTFPIPQSTSNSKVVDSDSVRVPITPGVVDDDDDAVEIVSAVPPFPETRPKLICKEVQLDANQVKQMDELISLLERKEGYFSLPQVHFGGVDRKVLLLSFSMAQLRMEAALKEVSELLSLSDTPDLRPFSSFELEEG